MTPGAAHPAGAISVRLATRAGRVDAVELRSSRPTDIARRLFAGRPVDYLMTTLPMVFSVCATAQACAAVQAVEAVSGSPADPAHTNARSLLVAAETNDLPVTLAVTVLVATAVSVLSLVADILYAVLDPRVRYR